MITATLTIWGILRDPISRGPNEHGRELLSAISQTYRTILLADDYTDEEWIRIERFTGHVSIHFPRPGHSLKEERVYQVNNLRSTSSVALVIDPDPEVCAALFQQGQPTLLYSHPRYTHLRHRPGRKAWADLEKVVDTTRQLKSLIA